jgi:hypothetical protein
MVRKNWTAPCRFFTSSQFLAVKKKIVFDTPCHRYFDKHVEYCPSKRQVLQ